MMGAAPLARAAAALPLIIAAAYGCGALYFRGPRGRATRLGVVGLWGAAAIAGLAGLAIDAPVAPAVFGVMALSLAGWWATVRPRTDRPWAPDVARLPTVTRRGARVHLTNVRNFVWQSRERFRPRWETRVYDRDRLRAVDLFVSYWNGPLIAHTIVSFAFEDGGHLAFSVEVRRLAGGDFSALGGLFRQCELALVAADERDVIRTRTTVRGEAVHMYRVAISPSNMRALFDAYLDIAESLTRRPRFYNTLTSNCTTLVYRMVRSIVPGIPWDWRLLASGRLPDYLYTLGALDRRLPLDELRRRGYINDRARASDIDGRAAPDFSAAIRRGVPAPADTPRPPP